MKHTRTRVRAIDAYILVCDNVNEDIRQNTKRRFYLTPTNACIYTYIYM